MLILGDLKPMSPKTGSKVTAKTENNIYESTVLDLDFCENRFPSKFFTKSTFYL